MTHTAPVSLKKAETEPDHFCYSTICDTRWDDREQIELNCSHTVYGPAPLVRI